MTNEPYNNLDCPIVDNKTMEKVGECFVYTGSENVENRNNCGQKELNSKHHI